MLIGLPWPWSIIRDEWSSTCIQSMLLVCRLYSLDAHLAHFKTRSYSEWVEALGWYQQEDKNNVTGTGKEWFYHWKADELKRVNPSALVPTIMPVITNNEGKEVVQEDKAVFESLVTIDYIDAMSGATGKDRLNPLDGDPYLAAQCRIWMDRVNRDCCSPY